MFAAVVLLGGAAVAYVALVGVVYGLLLTGYQQELQTTLPWVDTIVHRILPIVMVIDWLVDPPERPISLRETLAWLVYPLVYLTFALIHAPQVDWWPYPFLNPHHENQGYGVVALYCAGIAVGFLVFIWIVTLLSQRPRR